MRSVFGCLVPLVLADLWRFRQERSQFFAIKNEAIHFGHDLIAMAALAAASVRTLCSVLYRPYLQRYPTLPVSAYAMLDWVLFLAVMAMSQNWQAGFSQASSRPPTDPAWPVPGLSPIV